MRAIHSVLALTLVTLGSAAACSSSSSSSSTTSATTSASTTSSTTTTAAGGSSQGGSSQGGSSQGGSGGASQGGSSQGGGGGAGGGCGTLAGAYVGSGKCSAQGYVFPPALCVAQDGCNVQVMLRAGDHYDGVVNGEAFDVKTSKPVNIDCTGDLAGDGTATMSCTGAGITCSGDVKPVTLKGASTSCCDVMKQQCAAGERCQVVGSSDPNALFTGCIADDGKAASGEPCTRASDAAEDIGHDTCAKGGFCSGRGVLPGTYVCRPYCWSASDCAPGNICRETNAAPIAGYCLPLCKMGAGDTCGQGLTCRIGVGLGANGEQYEPHCDPVGAGQPGDACKYSDECGEGVGCVGGMCRSYCDGSHPCAAGTCTKLSGPLGPNLPADAGYCK